MYYYKTCVFDIHILVNMLFKCKLICYYIDYENRTYLTCKLECLLQLK